MSRHHARIERSREQTQQRVELVVRRLREAADEIEHRLTNVEEEGPRTDVYDMGSDYGDLAADTIHTVTWMLANMGLDRLTNVARDADVAERAAKIDEMTVEEDKAL